MFSKNPTISIIIPCYNTGKWINQCLDSICTQESIMDIAEIITVNDASTDETAKILEHYSQKGLIKNISLSANKGVSNARNEGIKNSNGDYIWCIDSDDFLLQSSGREIIKLLEISPNQDMYAFGYITGEDGINGIKRTPFRSKRKSGKFKTSEEALFQLFSGMRIYTWNKIIKREICLNNPYPPNKTFEDTETIPIITSECTRVSWISNPLIYYRINRNGITNTINEKSAIDLFHSTSEFLKEYEIRSDLKTSRLTYAVASFQLRHCLDAICYLLILNKNKHQKSALELLELIPKTLLENPRATQRKRLCHLRYQVWRTDRELIKALDKKAKVDDLLEIAMRRMKVKT